MIVKRRFKHKVIPGETEIEIDLSNKEITIDQEPDSSYSESRISYGFEDWKELCAIIEKEIK